MTALTASGIDWSVDGVRILDGVNLEAPAGQVLGVLGPNGAGKTSLLRVLAGLRRPDRGRVLLDGTPLRGAARRTVARRLAIVEQSPEVHSDITVDETVALGRTPHRGVFAALDRRDHAAIEHALTVTGLTDFRERSWRTLSGGERQRAQLARALAQEPETIVLDEPTNHLDIRYQLEMLSLLRGLGLTVVTALHDLNLAARFCDRLVVLRQGRVVATGPPTEILTATLIHDVYAVDAVVEVSPHTGAPSTTFLAPTAEARPPWNRRGPG